MQTLDFKKMENIERSASRKRAFYRWLLFITLGIFALYYLAPLYVMIITSLKSMEEIRQGNLMTLPGKIMFDAWKTALETHDLNLNQSKKSGFTVMQLQMSDHFKERLGLQMEVNQNQLKEQEQ